MMNRPQLLLVPATELEDPKVSLRCVGGSPQLTLRDHDAEVEIRVTWTRPQFAAFLRRVVRVGARMGLSG